VRACQPHGGLQAITLSSFLGESSTYSRDLTNLACLSFRRFFRTYANTIEAQRWREEKQVSRNAGTRSQIRRRPTRRHEHSPI
jgi:hypothetical protein